MKVAVLLSSCGVSNVSEINDVLSSFGCQTEGGSLKEFSVDGRLEIISTLYVEWEN